MVDLYRLGMRIAFPIYPDALTGVALLLLRIAIPLAWYSEMAGTTLPGGVQMLKPSLVLSIFLVLGFCTRPASATLAVLLGIGGAVGTNGSSFSLLGGVLECVALALLGAGVWSVDERLFGRRIIKISRQPR